MREDRRTEYTERAIKQAYLSILREDPDHLPSVKHVCDVANLNRGTFYLHYLDILDLQEKLEEEFAEEFLSVLPPMGNPDPEGNYIVDLVDRLYREAMALEDFGLVFLGAQSTGKGAEKIMRKGMENSISRWVQNGMTQKEAERLFGFVCGGLGAVFDKWKPDRTLSLAEAEQERREWTKTIAQMLMYGMTSFYQKK